MKAISIAAIVLIAVGVLVLVYGQFSYTEQSDGAKLGPIALTITEKKTVNIPVWAGVGCVLAGVVLFAYPLVGKRWS